MNTNKRDRSSSTDSSSTYSKCQKQISRTEELEIQLADVEARAQDLGEAIFEALDLEVQPPQFGSKLITWVAEMKLARKDFCEDDELRPPPNQIDHYGSCGQPLSLSLKLTGVMLANLAQKLYHLVQKCIELKAALNDMLPDPSEYAFKDAWRDAQAKKSDILCLRPPERTGLPLSTLHDAFRQFERDATIPFHLSADSETTSAARAASLLVHEMGNAFDDEMVDDEEVRSEAIERCLKPVFPYFWSKEIHCQAASQLIPNSHTIDIATSYRSTSGSVTILRVDKDEPGSDGDPYMQISRGYHMFVEMLKDRGSDEDLNTLAHGAPTFLICFLGKPGLHCHSMAQDL